MLSVALSSTLACTQANVSSLFSVVTLYTIQHRDVVDTLARGHVYAPAWRFVWPEFREAYRWLCGQHGWDQPPVWFWPSKDLCDRDVENREDMSLLTVSADDVAPVYLHFDAWHFVLNNQYACTEDEDMNAPRSRASILLSWRRLLDPNFYWGSEEYLGSTMQALLPRIYPEDVLNVEKA